MATAADPPATYVWLILSAITVDLVVAGTRTPGRPGANVSITVAVCPTRLHQGRLIIRYFMEVRTAPSWLKVHRRLAHRPVGGDLGDLAY